MGEINIKNESIASLNMASYGIGKITRRLGDLYNKSYPNLANIYMEKVYDLEKSFKDNGMTFYTNNVLGDIIINHFDTMLRQSCELINVIAQNISEMPASYIFLKLILLLNKKYVNEYESLCSEFNSFSLERDIEVLLSNYFKLFYLYVPGEFINKYNEIKKILEKLNINISNLDDRVLPIIEQKESEILLLYECAKVEINSDNEDDIRNYISTMVEQFKGEIKGKQKKRI